MAERRLNAEIKGKNETKPVNTKPAKPAEEQRKYTYDELMDICNQLVNANEQLKKQLGNATGQLRQMNEAINFKIVDNMFKIIENSTIFSAYDHDDCVKKAVDAVNDFMFQEVNDEQEPTESAE